MKNAACILSALFIAGCASIVQPFVAGKPDYATVPEQALRQVATEIETAIENGQRTPDIADREGVVVNTESIRQAIRTRAARVELVKTFLATGHAVEKDDGLIWIIDSKDYKRSGNRRSRNRDALLINRENDDRRIIYEGIAEASGMPSKSRGAMRKIFRDARTAL